VSSLGRALAWCAGEKKGKGEVAAAFGKQGEAMALVAFVGATARASRYCGRRGSLGGEPAHGSNGAEAGARAESGEARVAVPLRCGGGASERPGAAAPRVEGQVRRGPGPGGLAAARGSKAGREMQAGPFGQRVGELGQRGEGELGQLLYLASWADGLMRRGTSWACPLGPAREKGVRLGLAAVLGQSHDRASRRSGGRLGERKGERIFIIHWLN
jgi:hypothetical protein